MLRNVKDVTRCPVAGMTVYSMEVEEDHSFIADGIAIHNCVSRGVARAAQASLDWEIIKKGALLQAAEIAFAPIYSLARHEFGQDRVGYGDGAILSDAVEAIHNLGYASTDLFAGMTEVQQEQLAVKYATPGVGTPAAWQAACKGHAAKTMSPDSLELLFDGIAAGYGAAYACNYITGDTANSDGMYRLGSPGGHCRCFVGLAVDHNGNTQLEGLESWSAYPASNPDNKYSTCDVSEIPCCTFNGARERFTLAPGSCILDSNQFWNEIQRSGEVWLIGAPSFDPDSMSDLTKPPAVA